MKSLFIFYETLEVIINGVPELGNNATDDQRVSHKDGKKKDNKSSFCIQSPVDTANFNRIFHAELAKETCDILIKYYEEGEKIKLSSCRHCKGNMNYYIWEKRKTLNAMCHRCIILFISWKVVVKPLLNRW